MGNCKSQSGVVSSENRQKPLSQTTDLFRCSLKQIDEPSEIDGQNKIQQDVTLDTKRKENKESTPISGQEEAAENSHEILTTSAENKEILHTKDTKEIIKKCWEEVDRQCHEHRLPTSSNGQSTGWKIARVFVSSTFTDFHNEREILVKKVFPEVREWCEDRHINLIDCDLRWGIRKEATTGETISTCLEELDRCHEETDGKPFFFGMVGKRYGWIPHDEDVPDELKQKFQWIKNTSITFMEFLHGALRCKSPNAAYFIRSDDTCYESIPEKYLKRFVDKDCLKQEHLNELKKRLQKDFPTQVYKYSCKVEGVTIATDTGRENVKLTDFEQFAQQAVEFLKSAIIKTFGDHDMKTVFKDDVESENQKLFVESKSEFVVGQDILLKTLKSYIQGQSLPDVPVSEKSKTEYIRDPGFWEFTQETDNMIMCVKGHPGYGKSTLLAKLVKDLVKDGCDIFYHFVGCSGSSKNTLTMYKRLLKALENRVGDLEKEKEEEVSKEDGSLKGLKKKMKTLIAKMRDQQINLVIVIDAVNELSDSDTQSHMIWLPPMFPSNIKCIISSADNSPRTLSRLTEHPCYVYEVLPITKETAELIIDHSLQKFNKKLDSEQLSMITSRSCATNPLWITLMSEELRVFGDFRNLNKKIDQLSNSVESLLTAIINRLLNEDDDGLVKRALTLLVCSVDGILTKDFINLLGNFEKKEPLPRLYWARTRRVLKPYIKEIGAKENVSFYHLEIQKAVKNVLKLHDYRDKKVWNEQLATYFLDWCQDEFTRVLYVPEYCMRADFKVKLVKFIRNDPHSAEMSSWDRSQYMQSVRCPLSADSKGSFCGSVVLCDICSHSNKGLSPQSVYLNEDCCILCGEYNGNWHATPAYYCSEHSFGRNYTNCMLCHEDVWTDNKGQVTYMGCNGKMCDNCGFGYSGELCAFVPTGT